MLSTKGVADSEQGRPKRLQSSQQARIDMAVRRKHAMIFVFQQRETLCPPPPNTKLKKKIIRLDCIGDGPVIGKTVD